MMVVNGMLDADIGCIPEEGSTFVKELWIQFTKTPFF